MVRNYGLALATGLGPVLGGSFRLGDPALQGATFVQ